MEREQIELAEVFRELDRRGCYLMLSNSNTEFIKNLYRGYQVIELYTGRAINCRADRRGKKKLELLIKNF